MPCSNAPAGALAHAGVEFDPFGGPLEEIVAQAHLARLEEDDGGGSSEGEVAHFITLGHGSIRSVSRLDAPDTGGPDRTDEHLPKGSGIDRGNGPFVLPEVGEALTQGDGIDRVERAGKDAERRGHATDREMETMIVDRTEAREEEAASRIAFCEGVVAKKAREVEALPFHVKLFDFRDVLKSKVTAVCRKDEGFFSGGDRPRVGLQFPIEELIESRETVRSCGELCRIESILRDERSDFGSALRSVHAPAVPLGKGRPFDESGKGKFP